MKNTIKPLIWATLLIGILGTACQSHEKKADDIAFDDVKKEKMNEKDTVVRIVTDTSQITVVKNTVQLVQWSQFENELKGRISANDLAIKNLRQRKIINENRIKYEKNISNLENENAALKKRLEEYTLEQKKFQDRMNRDIHNLEKQLNDIKVHNTK